MNAISIIHPQTTEATENAGVVRYEHVMLFFKSRQVSLTHDQLKWYALHEISLMHRIRTHCIRIAEQTIRLINHGNFVPH